MYLHTFLLICLSFFYTSPFYAMTRLLEYHEPRMIHIQELFNNEKFEINEKFPHYFFYKIPLKINPELIQINNARLNESLQAQHFNSTARIVSGTELNAQLNAQSDLKENHYAPEEKFVLITVHAPDFFNTHDNHIVMPLHGGSDQINARLIAIQSQRRIEQVTNDALKEMRKEAAPILDEIEQLKENEIKNFKKSLKGSFYLVVAPTLYNQLCGYIAKDIGKDIATAISSLFMYHRIKSVTEVRSKNEQKLERALEKMTAETALISYLEKINSQLLETRPSAIQKNRHLNTIQNEFCRLFQNEVNQKSSHEKT